MFRRGNSQAVVQLGAYANPQRVASAWTTAAKRYAAVRAYSPVSARFDGPKGTVYRLSLKGFASDRDARLLCESLRQSRRQLLRPQRRGRRPGPVRLALGRAADQHLQAGHSHGHAHFDLKRDQRALADRPQPRSRSRLPGSSAPGCITTASGAARARRSGVSP